MQVEGGVAITKGFTVRLDDEQASELEAVAKAAGVPVAEEIRQAILGRIEERRQDEEFRARLCRPIEEDQRILDRLAHEKGWRELDRGDFLLIVEAVLDVPAEDVLRAGVYSWPTRRCMRRRRSSVGWSSTPISPGKRPCWHRG